MDNSSKLTRRSILHLGTQAAAAAGLASLFGSSASASSGANRACVCIYLIGGNDSNNMIVPLDAAAYGAYARGRGALALAAGDLLSVRDPATSASYGFHPSLTGLRDLYNQGVLAVLANVGRMDGPVNKAQLLANPAQLPKDQFEHTGMPQVRYLPNARLTIPWVPTTSPLSTLDHGVTLAAPDAGPASPRSSAQAGTVVRLPEFPRTRLGMGLEVVARSLSRGDFQQDAYFCALSGFDTHTNELSRQAELFSELNDALVAFHEALRASGLADRVTTFTQTDFNRTLAPNAQGGADHAWGGHQLILGGSVHGGEIFGRFPSLELGGPDDLGTTGVWIPTTSIQQYAASLATWFGVSRFAELAEFSGMRGAAQQPLTFLTN